MNFPNYFADAESNFNDADFVIFGIPYDKTSSFRLGARKGPDEIRLSSWNFETYNIRTGRDLKEINFHDYGNLDVENLSPIEMVKSVKNFTSKLLEKNKFPIALGGEHSITPGIIQAYPKDIAVISLDAHLDFRQKYEDEPFNHACSIRRIADHVDIKNIAVIGVRSAEKEELDDAKKQGLFYIDAFNIRKNGILKVMNDTKKYIGDKNVYLTLDIDVLDIAYAPGTSTPEPFGITSFDVIEFLDYFSPQLIGFDVVEVCPDYDKGQTALIAAKFVRQIIENVYFKRKS